MLSHKQLSKPFFRRRCKKKIVFLTTYTYRISGMWRRHWIWTGNVVFPTTCSVFVMLLSLSLSIVIPPTRVIVFSWTFVRLRLWNRRLLPNNALWSETFSTKSNESSSSWIAYESSVRWLFLKFGTTGVDKLTIYQTRRLFAWSLEIALRFSVSIFFSRVLSILMCTVNKPSEGFRN